jgi:hypothetical protein
LAIKQIFVGSWQDSSRRPENRPEWLFGSSREIRLWPFSRKRARKTTIDHD